ncbi:protein FAM8A1-like [Mytilus galloprovincialis]|uniref:protein FAM8A1-like n=1 Tax=Mytilus galloprovincialis TaxID=29158 RepID=UPI003F7C7CB7
MDKKTMKNSDFSPKNFTETPENEQYNLKQRFTKQSTREENKNTINMREYAQQLAPWIHQYRLWTTISTLPPTFPHQAMSCMQFGGQQTFQSFGSAPVFPTASPIIHNQIGATPHWPQAQNRNQRNVRNGQETTTNRLGTEYMLPPLWKRVLAEVIDFIVLFYLKIIIMIMVMRQMGILKTENVLNVHIDVVPYFDLKNMEMDIDKAFTMTSEIIALEIVNRIMITLFETFCLRKGMGSPGGATPGKRLLGMVVVSCENIMDLGNGKVLVIPAEDIGFINALVRSVIKNFTLAFFFPACLTVFFFQHNRAAYDILAKTIVVEHIRPIQRNMR